MSDGTRALLRLLTVLLIAVALTGLTTTAMAGARNPAAGVAKKKKKSCSPGTHRVVIKRHGRKKRKCVPNAMAPSTAVLSISPSTYRFPDTEHGGFPCQVGTTSCSTKDFTVTNTGTQQSGVLIVGVREVHNPEVGGPSAFLVS